MSWKPKSVKGLLHGSYKQKWTQIALKHGLAIGIALVKRVLGMKRGSRKKPW